MSVTQLRCVLRTPRLVPIMISILSRIYADPSVFTKKSMKDFPFLWFFIFIDGSA